LLPQLTQKQATMPELEQKNQKLIPAKEIPMEQP
jgi:hypothetical protein